MTPQLTPQQLSLLEMLQRGQMPNAQPQAMAPPTLADTSNGYGKAPRPALLPQPEMIDTGAPAPSMFQGDFNSPTPKDTQTMAGMVRQPSYMNAGEPEKPKGGFMGFDKEGLMGVGTSLLKAAQVRPAGQPGGGWGDALEGVTAAQAGVKGRQEQAGQSDAQRRAMMAMQAGDMDGALRILSSTKGMEGAALQAQMAMRPKQMAAYEQAQVDADKRKPIIANPGDRGYRMNDAGEFDEIFKVPETPGSNPGSVVQSTYVNSAGKRIAIMRDGTERELQDNQNLGQVVDIGGVPSLVNRQAGSAAPISTAQQVGTNKAEVSDITTRGEARTQAQISLPDTIAKAEQNLSVIKSLVEHPGFENRYGMNSLGGRMPSLPGGEGAGAQALIKQVTGTAFLEAFQSLKGGGQITQIEGEKATNAITRLTDQNISPKEAKQAATDLMKIVESGVYRAKAKADMLTDEDYDRLVIEYPDLLRAIAAGD